MKFVKLVIALVVMNLGAYAETSGFSITPKVGQTNSGISETVYSTSHSWSDLEIDSGTNYGVAAEYLFTEMFGVGLQYLSTPTSASWGNLSEDLTITSISLYGIYKYDFTDKVYFNGKVGASKNSGDVDFSYINSVYWPATRVVAYTEKIDFSWELDSTSVFAGVDVGYKFNDMFSVEASVMYLGEDLTSVELGAKISI